VTTRTPSTAGSRAGFLLLALVGSGLTAAAAGILFSTFMVYDDEGYVLLSLRHAAEHGGLYRDVYTQYGPFPFVLYQGLHALGLPFTHHAGRLVTLAAWAGTAWACSLLVWTATRSLVLRLATLPAAFVFLWIMANEPTHPGGLIALGTALLALLGWHWLEQGRETAWAATTGAGIALLTLTKVNLGAFAAFSSLAWLLLFHRADRLRRWAPALVALAGAALPFLLMRPLLDRPAMRDFALTFAGSAVAVTLAGAAGATGRAGSRCLRVAALTGGLAAAVILAVVLLQGTRPQDLLQGIVLGPLRHPVSFSLGFPWPDAIHVVTVLSVSAAAGACLLRRRGHGTGDVLVALARLAAALALAATLARYPETRPDHTTFPWLFPLLWLFAWPLPGDHPGRTAARIWVVLLLLGQSLHAFPVPGSQVAWGTLLAVPLAALGAWEAGTWLAGRFALVAPDRRRLALAASAALAIFGALTTARFARVASRYPEGESLGLPGAELVRLPEPIAAELRFVGQNALAHADVLFSLPGMFSFNLWTGLPTPTLANVTHWFSLLDPARQDSIRQVLEDHPRAALVTSPENLEFLLRHEIPVQGPLVDYLRRNFEVVPGSTTFHFLLRRDRLIRPFLLGERLTLSPNAKAPTGTPRSLLKLTLFTRPGSTLGALEIASSRPGHRLRLDAGNARLELTPVSSQGEPIGPARPAPWPAPLGGPVQLSVFYDAEHLPPTFSGAVITLRDPAGEEIGLALLH
jgi:hypothetical protein